MAVLHHKEEKIQAVLGRLPKKYSPDDFVTMFVKLYSKDWGKIKSAYIKASQDKEPGTVIHMPKPDLYLKQILETFLSQKPVIAAVEVPKEIPTEIKATVPAKKSKTKLKEIESDSTIAETTATVKAKKAKPTLEKETAETVVTKKPRAVKKKVD